MKTAFAKVASKYAAALLELAAAAKAGTDEAVLRDLVLISQAVGNAPDFYIVINHPSVSASQKKSLLVDIFQGKVDELTLRLLELLSDKRRLNLLTQIEASYRQLFNSSKNIATASLTSADPITDTEKEYFKTRLIKKLGKHLELEVITDRSLLGGLVLRVGDEVIDGSLKGKLRALEKSLLSV